MFSATELGQAPRRHTAALGFCKYLTSELLAYWKATFALFLTIAEAGGTLVLDADGLPTDASFGIGEMSLASILAASNGREYGLMNDLAEPPRSYIPDELSRGSQALAWTKRETPLGPLVILIGFQDRLSVDAVEQLRQLLVVIRSSMPVFSVRPKPRGSFGSHLLSARQRQIMTEMCEGSTYRQIAATMFISESTVKQEVKRIFATLGVSKRADAITLYLNQLRKTGQH